MSIEIRNKAIMHAFLTESAISSAEKISAANFASLVQETRPIGLVITNPSSLNPQLRRNLGQFGKPTQLLQRERSIATIEKSIQRYETEFAPHVRSLQATLSNTELRRELIQEGETENKLKYERLAYSEEGPVYKVTLENMQTYVVKLFEAEGLKTLEERAPVIAERLSAMLRATDLPEAVQLVAHSFEDGVLMMDLAQGERLDRLYKHEQDFSLTDDDIKRFMQIIVDFSHKGLGMDVSTVNIFMDKNTRKFSIIDYSTTSIDSLIELSLANILGMVYESGTQNYQQTVARILRLIQELQLSIDMEQIKNELWNLRPADWNER